MRVFVLTVLVVACFAAQTRAGLITDRTTFEGGTAISYLEDFETLGPGTSTFTGPVTLPSGLVVSSPSNDLFEVGAGQSTNPTQAIGSDRPRGDSLNFDLGGDFNAFGADFFQNDGGGTQFLTPIDYQVDFFDDGVLVDSIVSSVAPNGGSFIGYTGALFDEVFVTSQATGGSFEVADNVTVGNELNGVVPEPGSALLWTMIGGGAAAGSYRRRRR